MQLSFAYLKAGLNEYNTDWKSEKSWFTSLRGERFYLLYIATTPAMRPTQPPIQWVRQTLYPGIKQRVNDFDHSPQFGQSPQFSARLRMGHSDVLIDRTWIPLPARSLYALWSGDRPFLWTISFLGQMFSSYTKLSWHCLLLTEASEYLTL
jgi:hypothetical protein